MVDCYPEGKSIIDHPNSERDRQVIDMTTPLQPIKIDHQPVTLQDIARRCGFTKSTVSRALLNDPRVKAKTREHILAIADKMGYRPGLNTAARRLVLRSHGLDILNHNIALCIRADMYAINYFALLFRGILAEVAQTDFTVLLILVPDDSVSPSPSLPISIERGEIDGVLVCAGINNSGLSKKLRNHPLIRSCPVVSTLTMDILAHPKTGSGSAELTDISAVLADEEDGAYRAAQHLLQLGHRHLIHYTGHTGQRNYQQRLAGVARAFTEQGLDPQAHIHKLTFPTEWISPSGLFRAIDDNPSDDVAHFTRQLLRYLADHPEVTALLPLNDANAIRSWRVLQHAGYRIPEDLSIIGFDDTDTMPDHNGRNLLSSVHLPLEEIGRNAVRLLVQQIESRQHELTELVLPTHLELRASTGPARPRRK